MYEKCDDDGYIYFAGIKTYNSIMYIEKKNITINVHIIIDVKS